MKRTRLKNRSEKRDGWNLLYIAIKAVWTPTECARCSKSGSGWMSNGGDFDAHHPYGRRFLFFMLCFLPFCRSCHDWTHSNAKDAREEGWLIKPVRLDIFGNRKP